jgi:phosphoribosylanthranilate isomerase
VSVLVKICGLTRPEDVAAAVEAGADLVGFVLEASSPRSVTPERAAQLAADVPAGVRTVAVVVSGDGPNPAITDLVQTYEPAGPLHRTIVATRGEPPADVPEDVPLLLDLAFGSSPDEATLEAHWQRAAHTPGRVMLAGSLTPRNVAAAVATARPWAVDTARGVESAPGIKDHDLIRRFVTEAKEAAS